MPTRLPNGGVQLNTSDVQSLLDTPDVQDARAAFLQWRQQNPPGTPLSPGAQREGQQLQSELTDAVQTATAGTPYAVVEPSSILKDFVLPAALMIGGGFLGGAALGGLGDAAGEFEPGLIDTATMGAGGAAGTGASEGLQQILNNPSDSATPSNTTQRSQARLDTVPGGGAVTGTGGIQGPGGTIDASLADPASSSLIPGISNNTLALGGLNVLGNAFRPAPYPPRVSYVGTSADPIQFMTELHAKLNSGYDQAMQMLNAGPTPLPGAQPQPLGTGPFAPHRARGGPVRAGHAYTVGEQGPEQFTPQHSGTITPTRRPLRIPMPMPVGRGQTPAAAAAGGGGAPDAVQGKAAAMLLLHALSGS